MASRDEAFTEFVRTSAASLRRTAYLICSDWHRADDATQDALYRLYLAWPRVARAANTHAYARRAVVNAVMDGARRPWRRERSFSQLPDTATQDPAGEVAARDEIFGLLAALAPRQRACVVLRFYDGLSVEETAQMLDCSAGTVRSQTSRGLNHLRQLLTEQRAANREEIQR